MRTQTRPMPENTVAQIQGNPDDEFSELREEAAPAGGLLAQLAASLGISPAKIATVLGAALPGKSKLNATCPKCSKPYKYFSDEGYQEDQSICPACRDEAMAVTREAAMRPEKLAAKTRMQAEEAKIAEAKDQSRKETIELVAQTVAQILPQLQKADK
jgi:uncharacterized Zn finger protein (UPF0148 family)